MGYHTEFKGKFNLNKPLDDETYNFLIKFNETRRMARNTDPKFGVEGEFFVDGFGFRGQDNDPTIIDHNRCPSTQPGLWCQWRPSEDRMHIEWDEGEKFFKLWPPESGTDGFFLAVFKKINEGQKTGAKTWKKR